MHMRFIRWFSGSHRLAFGLFAAAIAGLFMGGLLLPTVQFVDETATRFPGGLAGVLEYTNQLTVGDLDGDGDLDLVFANGGGFSTASAPLKLRVWINTGVNSGVFADETDARTGGLTFIARGCELGDVERDGDLDIIIAQDFNRQPTLLINNGSGVFANETATRLPVGTFSSTRAQFGDVDNDGDLDIYINNAGATNRFGSGRGKLWLNNGSGVFADVTATNTVNETVGQPMDAIFGDIDGDFDLDVHVGSRSGTSKLYRNNGAGVFSSTPITGGATAYSYDFGDMDSDGDLDLVGANAGAGNTELSLLNDGTGTYSTGPFTGSSIDDNDSKFFDIDDDGDYDILIAAIGGPERIYVNGGGGSYVLNSRLITQVNDSSLDVKVADFNNDARYDIVTAQGESGSFLDRIYMNTGAADTRPPTIARTEQLPNTANVGPFVVRMEAWDAHTSDRGFHDKGITLYWRRGGVGAFAPVDMKWSGNALWRGVIPAQSNSGLMEYYVTARDFANNLATGPTKSFTLTLPCPSDIAGGDGQVDVNDLLAVITTWGSCPGCPPAHCAADIAPLGPPQGDCQIDVNDLLAVITTWGACP